MYFFFVHLDTSNWMCFVRPAKTKHEQNMIVDQVGDYLYFTTTRAIFQREELLVGYSTFYAHKRGLRLLPTGMYKRVKKNICIFLRFVDAGKYSNRNCFIILF